MLDCLVWSKRLFEEINIFPNWFYWGWHWLIQLDTFQVYISIIHHLYIVLGIHYLRSSQGDYQWSGAVKEKTELAFANVKGTTFGARRGQRKYFRLRKHDGKYMYVQHTFAAHRHWGSCCNLSEELRDKATYPKLVCHNLAGNPIFCAFPQCQ